MRLSSYQHLYWQDFPESALLPSSSWPPSSSQLSAALLERLNTAALISPRPPCIHAHLSAILARGPALHPFPVLAPPLSAATQVGTVVV